MVNAHSTQTAGLAGGFLRAKTEKLKKVLRSILTEYPAGVYNQDTPIGYLKNEVTVMEECCCQKTKVRTDEEYKSLMNRLNRIEGQIRGLKGMLEKNAYCPDILTQAAAANAAVNAFCKELLADHIRTCVAENIRAGNDEVIDELVRTMQKLMK